MLINLMNFFTRLYLFLGNGCKNSIQLLDSGGRLISFRKSFLCWFLSSKGDKVCSDRLNRFITKSKKPRNDKISSADHRIAVGNWCCFLNGCDAVIGKVMGFRYANAKGKKNQEYTSDFIDIISDKKKT